MPVLDGIAATRRLRVEHPGVRVLALTTFDDDEDVFAAAAGRRRRLPAQGRHLRPAGRGAAGRRPGRVGAAAVGRGQGGRPVRQLPDDAGAAPQPLVVPLSERELEVLRLLGRRAAATGRSPPALFLAEGTVKNHVTNVLAKLGARDRTQAALRARALGLL